MTPCAAGRTLQRPGDPRFIDRCPQMGQHILNAHGDPAAGVATLVMMICAHHMQILDDLGLLLDHDHE